jgi:aspartyl/asparaginyl beta-hydroxylase (cupin superfamily)
MQTTMSTSTTQPKKKTPKKPLPSWRQAPRRRALRVLKRRARPSLNRFLAHYSEVGDPVIFAPGTFAWEEALTNEWEAIREEALRVLEIRDIVPAFQEVSPDQSRITQGKQWKTFWLRGFGRRADVCADMCPTTDRILEHVPGVITAFFSILAPGSHIAAHRGVSKGIINCHLGLVVPDDRLACRIRVGRERFSWAPGELRIFDDTNKHEVWNETQQDRVVLMIQFERPLRTPGRIVRDVFFKGLNWTPYVRRARKNQLDFESRLARKLKG